MNLLIRLLVNALALMVSPYIISGVSVSNFYAALITAILLGIINAVIRPILIILTLPVTLLTLGLFTLVINGLLILFVSSFVKGFAVSGLWPAILLSLFLWAVSFITNGLLRDRQPAV
jgi:putative membrane protein